MVIMMKEIANSILEKRIIRYFKIRMAREGLRYKLYSLEFKGVKGAPDRLLVTHGLAVYIEFKRPVKGQISPHQAKVTSDLRAFKIPAEILWSEKDVDLFIDTYITPRRIAAEETSTAKSV